MDFKEKVQSMKFSEIMQAMITGLQKEHIKIDMTTYGEVIDDTCYGCAATNIICEISGKVFNKNNIIHEYDRALFLNIDRTFLDNFESVINALRSTRFNYYNIYANVIKINKIVDDIYDIMEKLPALINNYYKDDLPEWQEACDQIKELGY